LNHLFIISPLHTLSRKEKKSQKVKAIMKQFYKGIRDLDLFLVAQKYENNKIFIVSSHTDVNNAIQQALKPIKNKGYLKLGIKRKW